jgi:hypothetical protein
MYIEYTVARAYSKFRFKKQYHYANLIFEAVIWESEVNPEGCKYSAMQNAEPDNFCKITVVERKGNKGKGATWLSPMS